MCSTLETSKTVLFDVRIFDLTKPKSNRNLSAGFNWRSTLDTRRRGQPIIALRMFGKAKPTSFSKKSKTG